MNPYFEQTILNADPIELIRLLYQRAIFCVQEAVEHVRHKRIAMRSRSIMGAYSAIGELLAALRPDAAPELAGRLSSLYLYMQQRLLDANRQQSGEPLTEVLRLLKTLDDGWTGVAAQLSMNDAASDGSDAGRWRQPGQEHEEMERVAVTA